ncbi:replication initiation protein [Jiangella asiatica]|uniref:Replication initiation protein n=1 Tax=Jiangella asiatica TaxID=2530372 RepID=A0A4R5DFY1_9ACTN|nr:replication initiation protein [Jiangella asiatica]
MPDDATLRELAARQGVCVRPILQHVTDTLTGTTRTVVIACGATRAKVCPSCADTARRLRIQQCREGWHLDHDPPRPEPDNQDDEPENDGQADEYEDTGRRVRSTRRRQDAPNIPRLEVSDRTTGRIFEAPDGKTYRPSMFLTLTLPSYGRVTSEGAPADPATYDYRRAALDAMHFPKLVDRFWQNLRRATGYNVQYFATVEPQRRLAPHLHAAIRGAIPRKLIRQVVAATYHQVWWPNLDEPVHTDPAAMPVWDELAHAYADPQTGALLPSWDAALDEINDDPAAMPAHVIRAGSQVDIQGVIAGTPLADRVIGYLTKYLTKSITDPLHNDHDGEAPISAACRAHIDRLADEVRWLPCSPTCANWLRHGIQPKNPRPGLEPGRCTSKAHDRDHLGLGGRRVLVSRRWTGKSLDQHRADRAAVIRAVLTEAGIDMDDHDELSATTTTPDGTPRFVWTTTHPGDLDGPSYARLIAHAINQRQRWRNQYETAKTRAGPTTPDLSATARSTAAPAV